MPRAMIHDTRCQIKTNLKLSTNIIYNISPLLKILASFFFPKFLPNYVWVLKSMGLYDFYFKTILKLLFQKIINQFTQIHDIKNNCKTQKNPPKKICYHKKSIRIGKFQIFHENFKKIHENTHVHGPTTNMVFVT
jgi:hypothetical protein